MKTRRITLEKGMEIQRTAQSVQGIIICMTVPNFKGSLLRSVAQFVRSKRFCVNGLKPYHRVQDCRKKGACKNCGRKHSSLLPHPPVAGGNINKDQNSAGKQQENPAGLKDVNQLPQRSTLVLLKSSLYFVVLQEFQRQRLVWLWCP